MTHSLNKQLRISPWLPEIVGLMLIYERGLEIRTTLNTVKIKNRKAQGQLKGVTSISVKHHINF